MTVKAPTICHLRDALVRFYYGQNAPEGGLVGIEAAPHSPTDHRRRVRGGQSTPNGAHSQGDQSKPREW